MDIGQSVRSVAGVFFKWCGVLVLLAGLSACAWLDERQRLLIYRPSPNVDNDNTQLSLGDSRFFLPVPYDRATSNDPAHSGQAQRIALWWLPHADPAAPALLYLHGTLRSLPGNRPKIEALRQAGFSVLAVDYRGWGQSSVITPSESSITQDATVAFAELQRREPRPSKRVIYGHSMGSGAAVALAGRLQGRVDFGALILESAFTSFADVAREAGFWAGLAAQFTQERFASVQTIDQIQVPLLMIHGSQDNTIPPVLGQRLFAAAHAPKQWLLVEGGQHSDLHSVAPAQYQAALIAFRQQYLVQP